MLSLQKRFIYRFIFSHLLCVGIYVHVCYGVHVKIREQPVRVSYLYHMSS